MEHSFSLPDASGTAHHYTVAPHRGAEGAPLALSLMSLVVEPLATGAGPGLVDAIGSAESVGDVDMASIAKSLDLPGLSKGLRTAMTGLSIPLMCRLLKYVNRDGKPLVSDGIPTGAFDAAYSRNYMELGRALWKVASYNGFFPLPGSGSDDAAEAQTTA